MSTGLDPHRIVRGADFGWQPQALPFDLAHEMFWLRVAELGDAPMMRQKDLGIWRSYSWNEVATIATEIAAGLGSLGFEPGEVASVLANTSREWVWADLAVLSAGGVCNGIYPTDAASQGAAREAAHVEVHRGPAARNCGPAERNCGSAAMNSGCWPNMR